MSRAWLALMMSAAWLAACTGGAEGGDATPVPSAAPTTSAVSPTTIAEPPATITIATTTTTTGPPPTSLDDEIRAAYELIYQGYWACLRSPLDCDTSWLLDNSGSSLAMQDTMQGLADRGRFVGNEDVGYYVIEDITVEPGGTTAIVISCWWSTAVLYTGPPDPNRPASPDNPPTVVNDTPDGGRQKDRLQLLATRWLSESGELLGEGSSVNVCPSEDD